MPSAQDKIILDGSLGLESNVSQHSGDSHSFRVFRDLVTDVGRRILKRDGRGPTLGSVAGTEIQALHEYVYVNPTSGAETYHTIGAIDGGGYLYRWNGSTTWSAMTLPSGFTPTAGGRWSFMNAGNQVFAFNGIDALIIGIQTGPTTITWRYAGINAPTFAPTYSLAAADPPYSTGTVSATQGSPVITSSIGAVWGSASWQQKRIVINGNAYTISTVDVGGGGGVPQQITLTEPFNEVTASGMPYIVYLGIGSWDDIAPQYRFAYVNPTTGHVSNPSPILQVTETFQVNRTITVTIPASAENQAAYVNGYTKIQLFRTPKSAGIAVALNEQLNNVNSAVTTITYVETATKFADTYLTDFQAPLVNYKPPSGIAAMAFQGGRAWAVHKPSGRVIFTPLGVEVDFGVAIESWPPLFALDLSGPRGLVVVGGRSSADSLVIQTSHGDYSVEGFDPVTFTPYKVETNESGSYLGAATSARGRLFSYYADNKLLMLQEDLAQKIQDKLNLVKASLISKVRLHWFSANSRNYLLLSVPKGSSSTANDYTFVFDLDLPGGPIFEWNFGSSAYATVHDASTLALQLFAGDASGAVYRLFSGNHQDASANFAPTLTTALFRGDELREDIKYVKLFVNDPRVTVAPTTAWTGVLYINEQTSSGATDGTATAMTFRQMDYRDQSAQGRELEWTPTTSIRTRAKVFQIAITFPSADADLSIEQIIIGSKMDQLTEAGTLGGARA
jgi:hypothetical protein